MGSATRENDCGSKRGEPAKLATGQDKFGGGLLQEKEIILEDLVEDPDDGDLYDWGLGCVTMGKN